jgi:long-subunit acyl-CoA synthetase (AMP-forming)
LFCFVFLCFIYLFIYFALLHNSNVFIFENRSSQMDWMVTCLAAFRHNLTVVTVYATLGEDAAVSAINQTKASLVVCDGKLAGTLTRIHSQCPHLTHVIVLDGDSSIGKLPVGLLNVFLIPCVV